MGRPVKSKPTARTFRRTVQTRSCSIAKAGSSRPNEVLHLQGTENEVKCSICLDTTRCRKMKTLRCKHVFHEKCVNTSLQRNPSCPLCRFPCPHRTRSNFDNEIIELPPHDQLASSIMRYMLFFTFEMFDDLDM